jgi:hypothetical protein
MADKLIGGLFAKARHATRRRYEASARDVGRLIPTAATDDSDVIAAEALL